MCLYNVDGPPKIPWNHLIQLISNILYWYREDFSFSFWHILQLLFQVSFIKQSWVIPTPSIPDVTILCQRISSAVIHIGVVCYVKRSSFPGICQLVNERLTFSGVQFLIHIFICQIFSFSNRNLCWFPVLFTDFFIHFITSCSPILKGFPLCFHSLMYLLAPPPRLLFYVLPSTWFS